MKHILLLALCICLLCISLQGQSVTLAWDANTESDLAGYNMHRSQTSGSGYAKINPNIITGTTYTDNTIQYAIEYFFVCTALNTSGLESDYSNEVSYIEYNPNPPANPMGLRIVSQQANRLEFEWEPVENADTYRILAGLRTNAGIDWEHQYTTGITSGNLKLTGKYRDYIGIQSVNSYGVSGITFVALR